MSTASSINTLNTPSLTWTAVCTVDDILPNTGVCARVAGRHVAIFRVVCEHGTEHGTDQYYAIDNVDPKSQASVLSRGLVGNLGDRVVVASPLYKQHFDLRNGECLESPEHSVRSHPLRVADGQVLVGSA